MTNLSESCLTSAGITMYSNRRPLSPRVEFLAQWVGGHLSIHCRFMNSSRKRLVLAFRRKPPTKVNYKLGMVFWLHFGLILSWFLLYPSTLQWLMFGSAVWTRPVSLRFDFILLFLRDIQAHEHACMHQTSSRVLWPLSTSCTHQRTRCKKTHAHEIK